jgi:hypothetical protein
MDLCPRDVPIGQQTAPGRPVRRGLGQERQRWRFEPGVNLVKGPGQRCRWRTDAWMSDDREELVQAWPRNDPDCRLLGQLCNASRGCIMERRVFAMRVD